MRQSRNQEPVIEISFRDATGPVVKRFNNCWGLSQYFKDNPDVGKLFGYVKRSEMEKARSSIDDLWEVMKEFDGKDFMNNILYKDKGRSDALEAGYIERKANGYYITRSGRDFIVRMKGLIGLKQ
jgi:hypothetical protein